MWLGLRVLESQSYMHVYNSMSQKGLYFVLSKIQVQNVFPCMSLHPSKKIDKILYRFVGASFD
jgi:hypothetical protein